MSSDLELAFALFSNVGKVEVSLEGSMSYVASVRAYGSDVLLSWAEGETPSLALAALIRNSTSPV